MIKMFLALIIVSMMVFFLSETVKTLTRKQRWGLTKRVAYITLCVAIACVLLGSIVILF